MKKIIVRPAMIVGLFAALLAGPAFAQQATAGLGSAWPSDAQDVSQAPGFHAYMWMRSGVKYIQINDAAGNVLVAVATANGTILSLPMGIDAQRLQTSQNSNAAATAGTASNVTVTVYQDSTVTIVAGTSSDGGVMFRADTCTNPVECSTHLSPQ